MGRRLPESQRPLRRDLPVAADWYTRAISQHDDVTSGACAPRPLLSRYGFVVAGASLGLIDLNVLGTGVEQMLVRWM